jgi:hypothetical protein
VVDVLYMIRRQQMSAAPTKPKSTIKVTVIFPISVEGPYHAEGARQSAAGEVLAAALTHFKVAQDPEYEYYLTHDGKRVPDEKTLEQVAGEHEAVKFTLVKELVQGRS